MFKIMFTLYPSNEEITWFCKHVRGIGESFGRLLTANDTVNYIHMITYHAAQDLATNKSIFLFGNDVQETVNYYLKKTFENLSDRKDFLLAGMKRAILPWLISVEANLEDYQLMFPRRRMIENYQSAYGGGSGSSSDSEDSEDSMEEDA